MGRTNAKVFPLPVFAMPMQSRPPIITGTACAWMGRGRSKPALRNTSATRPLSPAWFQFFRGLGTSLPRTLMPSSCARYAATSASDMRASSGTSM